MKRGAGRILTTLTGSMPRPEDLRALMWAKSKGEAVDDKAIDARLRSAVAEQVRMQAECGVDIVCDGEFSKATFASYMGDRLTGFEKGKGIALRRADVLAFPDLVRDRGNIGNLGNRNMAVTGPIGWKDFSLVQRDIDNLKAALAQPGVKVEGAFLPSASPGVVARNVNRYYKTDEEYLEAIADAMSREYKAIVDAGFDVSIDCPDLASDFNQYHPEFDVKSFRTRSELRVEALNHALKGIPPEKARIHVCWGGYEGPHHLDIALRDVIDTCLKVNAMGLSIEGSNPRHAHEWTVWEDVKLPDDKVLIAGVVNDKTNWIEHPEYVAQQLVRLGRLVGRDRLMAHPDCGMSMGLAPESKEHGVHPSIVWPKLKAMAEGAALATKRL
jgi:5-methyltetrahydropteroyltriglutamate--homocysteine methyltransferase